MNEAPARVESTASRAEGSQTMSSRLQLLAANARPERNVYLNAERADLFAATPLRGDAAARDRAIRQTALEELRAGRSSAAIARLEAALDSHELSDDWQSRRLRSLLALAYLRLAEQKNCVEAHTSASCLVPITAAGVHRDEAPSRRAMEILSALLAEDPTDQDARWLLNIAAMTVGEYPHGIKANSRILPAAFASDYETARFPELAGTAGVAAFGLAGSVVLEDLDGDTHLDLMVSSWGLLDPLRYFRNTGSSPAAFEERTRDAGLEGLSGGLNLVHGDYDNDGMPDVLVLRGAWLGREGRHPNSLLRNLGGRFEDVTQAAGVLSFHPTQTAAWGDFDNDGWLDLFIGNESLAGERHPCELYRNNGDGTFTDVARDVGAAIEGYVKAVVWGDYDNDGWLDLYVSRLLEPNLLLRNEPDGDGARRLRDVTAEAGVGKPIDSFPAWFFDYDNDGWLDLFAAGYDPQFLAVGAANVAADYLGIEAEAETPRLYHNAGDGTFTDVTKQAGLHKVIYAMGANHGDLDNDGWPDFYLGTGAPDLRTLVPNRMFRNTGDGRFGDVTSAGGFGHIQKGHGVAFGDLDNDGDQDIYAVMGGAYSGDGYMNALFENPGNDHRWITLELEGVRENRSAIGARLQLELETPSGPRRVHATVSSGGSFGASSLRQEIGLADATELAVLRIQWPSSGTEQVFRNVAMDRAWRVKEGGALRPAIAEAAND